MTYGVDIASQRLDDLDKLALAAVSTANAPAVLELGCGSGGLTQHLAAAGANVVAVDIADYQRAVEDSLDNHRITFVQADIRHLPQAVQSKQYTLIVMQRVLHYLPYDDAIAVLRKARTMTNGPLYISVTGTETAIGQYYPMRHAPLRQRFAPVSEAGTNLFAIKAPVCLYTQDEFTSLLTEAGWNVESVWTSAFGNHKAVCL